ncbi:hypothetical protein EVA_13726 [gut metagenome]|uniref:Uncharacterized protein n=1 Tax=gut metagenome TaxID=749906 RepID=J9G8S9_9ZZZZ
MKQEGRIFQNRFPLCDPEQQLGSGKAPHQTPDHQ